MSYSDILRYAEVARAAYDNHAALKQTYGDTALPFDLPGSQVQLVLIRDPSNNIQWIAVRGTANTRNALVDGRIKVVREPRLRAYLHGGFLRASQEAYKAVQPRLDPSLNVRITGHSLGGAVAVILTGLLAESGLPYKLDRTVTFGQPMVTDVNGVAVLERYPLLRVVNRRDPVAILPLILSRTHFELRPTLFYHHAGPQLTLYADRAPSVSPPSRIVRFVFGYKRLIVNHFLDLYVQRLKALVGPGHVAT
jgi:triacylglycerol lipase